MSWVSSVGSRELIISDRTPVVTPPGSTLGYVPRNYAEHPYGSYADPLGDEYLIPREQWYERAQELERERRRLSDFAKRGSWKIKYQNGVPFCWIFGVVGACELVRIAQGQKYVKLSPASTGSIITGFRQRGGWGDEAARGIEKHGLVPESLWPQHAVSRRYDKPESWEIAKRYKLTEWNELRPRSIDHTFSCLLRGIPVPMGFNWWRHLIYGMDVVVRSKPTSLSDSAILRAFGTRIANSWGENWSENGYGILTGSRQLADGQLAIRSMRLTSGE